jgi:hypothetical protein
MSKQFTFSSTDRIPSMLSILSEKTLFNKGLRYETSLESAVYSTIRVGAPSVKHPFHLVEPSPLPILVSILLGLNLGYFICTMHFVSDYSAD